MYIYPSKLCCCTAYATHMTLFVAFASMQYFAQLLSLIFCFILGLFRVIASPFVTPSFIDVCLVLFCSAPLRSVFCSASSLCILSWLPVPGAFCVFSCACPSPSRSEHRGAHSDPSGGETSADQSPAQAGGRQRYGLSLNRMYLGKVCVVSFCFMKL